jgi:putative transposase
MEKRIRELERMLGKKTMENEILKEAVKIEQEKTHLAAALIQLKQFSISQIAETMEVSRSNLMQQLKKSSSPKPALYCRADDKEMITLIEEVIRERPTYGYRRVTILVNKQLVAREQKHIHHKRIFRLMSSRHLLLQKPARKPSRTPIGKVETLFSHTRWCSDSFSIQCFNGDRVHIAFSLDICDREVMRYVASTL